MIQRKHDSRLVRGLMLCAGASGRPNLLGRMSRAEREERASRRALLLAMSVALLATAAIVYGAVFLPELQRQASAPATRLLNALAAVSLWIVVVCLAFWGWRRGHLGRLRAETRRSVLVALGSPGMSQPGKSVGMGAGRMGHDGEALPTSANRRHYIQLLPVRRWG